MTQHLGSAATVAGAPSEVEWTPARVFLLITTIVHLPLALVGFLTDRTFPIGAQAAEAAGSAHIFGFLETNGWHTLGALIVGLVALRGTLNRRAARPAALTLGVTHVALFLSLVIWEPSTFWIASNNADQFVHAFTAIAGTASGLATRSSFVS
ncbi:MAG TPA: DUF4383 domain-containing protein [Actinomycetota bacterium]|nr:DUF4383 domain-containing protein [Actinomycetota bacterium]